jgi:ubiquinone/menaquinone biosynthesis C-methylase UbiE
MIIYIVLFLLILYLYLVLNEKEGFSLYVKQEVFQPKIYRNEKIDDSFYAYNYDDMNLTVPYSIELIQMIHSYFQMQGKTLCLGSKTGHMVQLLSKTTKTIGLDPSIAMIKMSRYKYPKEEFVQGSYTDESLFPNHTFSQVILPLFTLHTIPNFKEVCIAVKEWTLHSGYFFVCFADIRTFPIYKLVNHHPSAYFTSQYNYTVEIKDHKKIETITDTQQQVRTNIQDLYEYNETTLIYEARNVGFTHIKTLHFETTPISVCVFQHK